MPSAAVGSSEAEPTAPGIEPLVRRPLTTVSESGERKSSRIVVGWCGNSARAGGSQLRAWKSFQPEMPTMTPLPEMFG